MANCNHNQRAWAVAIGVGSVLIAVHKPIQLSSSSSQKWGQEQACLCLTCNPLTHPTLISLHVAVETVLWLLDTSVREHSTWCTAFLKEQSHSSGTLPSSWC